MIYLDSETCGLYGMPVLLQYAEDEGEIVLYEIWKEPISKTLSLLEWFCENDLCFFNAVFDWFMLCKIYTIFRLFPGDWVPEEHIQEIALREPEGMDGPCLKPKAVCDLMLLSRKGQYQSLMAREDIRIKRVPTALAQAVAQELEKQIEFDGIYFAKTVDKAAPRWKVVDIISKKTNTVNPDFKDVVLKFNAAGGLKYLAEYALGLKPKHYFSDVELDSSWRPYELGYAPTALAVAASPDTWECWDVGTGKLMGMAWPALIHEHIKHWHTHEGAREYANDDIVYTRALHKHFGSPEAGDDDSELACMVAAVRWHGFEINIPGIEELLQTAIATVMASPINVNKPHHVRRYMKECMDEMESIIIEDSTKKQNLEQIEKWIVEEEEQCTLCGGDGIDVDLTCLRCNGTGKLFPGVHPASIRATEILKIKYASKEIELYRKLLKAGRLHASFKIIGSLSSRMAGGDGLNAQGIKHTENVRKMFPLVWDKYVLCGGDFDSFEVTLSDAVFKDPNLHTDLCEGRSIHTILGTMLYNKTYEAVVASKSMSPDYYARGKSAVFAFIYGGDWNTWVQRLSVDEKTARKAYDLLVEKYPGIQAARMAIFDKFCSMRQPNGIGSQVIWHEPVDYLETFLGFRRYFTLENKVCKALYNLANHTPIAWKQCPVKVVRRDRIQTAGGAVSSALYGCAFQIQAANMRAANNHLIQSAGATITKRLQRKLWEIQPHGAHEWRVAPMNIHDEIMCVTHPEYVEETGKVAKEVVESYREQVPLIGMDWNYNLTSWANKKGDGTGVKIQPNIKKN